MEKSQWYIPIHRWDFYYIWKTPGGRQSFLTFLRSKYKLITCHVRYFLTQSHLTFNINLSTHIHLPTLLYPIYNADPVTKCINMQILSL